MKYIIKRSAGKVEKIKGSVVDTTNVEDKVTNAYSARVTEKLINDSLKTVVVPTKLGDLENDTGFITSKDVPTKTSQLINDSSFITAANSAITSKINYSDFIVTQHAVYASGISAYDSNYFSTDAYQSGYYPLGIMSPQSFWHNESGFTINPIRLSGRWAGGCTIYFWARNDANGASSSVTGYVDILWVKIK